MKILYEKKINTSRIVVSPRPVWKCKSCPDYGVTPSCPPHVPSWQETFDWLRSFKEARVIKFQLAEENNFLQEKREILHHLLALESELFKKNFYVHALFPGSCCLCEKCACREGEECTDRTRVRPSIDALGIEMSKVVEIDFNENVLYGMIVID